MGKSPYFRQENSLGPHISRQQQPVACLLIDYGGVLAEEGFRNGLLAIGEKFRKDPEAFFELAAEIVYSCGYVTGKATEHDFWQAVRKESGIAADDFFLTVQILSRFIPRPGMLQLVCSLKERGITACILSDQSDWLDRLDAAYRFFRFFDHVFNSFHLGKTKRDISIYGDVLRIVGYPPASTLFVDDNPGHIERARQCGLQAHLFAGEDVFRDFLRNNGLL